MTSSVIWRLKTLSMSWPSLELSRFVEWAGAVPLSLDSLARHPQTKYLSVSAQSRSVRISPSPSGAIRAICLATRLGGAPAGDGVGSAGARITTPSPAARRSRDVPTAGKNTPPGPGRVRNIREKNK